MQEDFAKDKAIPFLGSDLGLLKAIGSCFVVVVVLFFIYSPTWFTSSKCVFFGELKVFGIAFQFCKSCRKSISVEGGEISFLIFGLI